MPNVNASSSTPPQNPKRRSMNLFSRCTALIVIVGFLASCGTMQMKYTAKVKTVDGKRRYQQKVGKFNLGGVFFRV
jgi:hypothetical protein